MSLTSDSPTNARIEEVRKEHGAGAPLIFLIFASRGTLEQIAGRRVIKWRLWDFGFGFDTLWFFQLADCLPQPSGTTPKHKMVLPTLTSWSTCKLHICFAQFILGHVL